MAEIIRRYDNRNEPIIASGSRCLPRTYFNLIRLNNGQEYSYSVEGFETVCIVLSGTCGVRMRGNGFSEVSFDGVGGRPDIWSGTADSAYAPAGAHVEVVAGTDGTEVAVAGGRCDKIHTPFRVTPDAVEMVDVGSVEANCHRRIFHILGHNAEGRAGNLLVSELLCDPGNWSGFPPHKHDEEAGDEETAFEEVYHYRFRPDNGFGAQVTFQPDGSSQCFMTRHGDTYLLDRGYHPTVTSPGHEEYILTILVGKHRRSLIQNFREEYRYLMDVIPGIQDMRDKFK